MTTLALRLRFQKSLSVLGFCLLSNCAGTETGNPSMTRQVSMAMVLESSNSEAAQSCSSEGKRGGLNIRSAWLTTEYLGVLGCIGQGESELPPIAWNLLHPVAHKFGTQIPDFCGFNFLTRRADSSLGTIPAALNGASIWMLTTRADDTVVEIRSPAILNVERVDFNSPLSDSSLVVALDAAAWLGDLDVNSLTPDSDGVVRISPTSHPLLLQQVDRRTGNGSVLRSRESDDGVSDD